MEEYQITADMTGSSLCFFIPAAISSHRWLLHLRHHHHALTIAFRFGSHNAGARSAILNSLIQENAEG